MQDEKRYKSSARGQVTLKDILRVPGGQNAWDRVIGLGVPPTSLQLNLLSLANGNLPIYPPHFSSKEIRRFADCLIEDAEKIAKILQSAPFLEGLTGAGRRLPSLLRGFANEVERLKFYLPKRPHKPETWFEIAIVNNIVWATGYDRAKETFVPEKVEHHFETAADLINAAYAAAGLQKVVDARNLARSWYRYSHMRVSLGPKSSSK